MSIRGSGIAFGLAMSLAGFFAKESKALDLVAANYTITFNTSWDTVQTASILGKSRGLFGMALLSCNAGALPPNLDSLAQFYADSLGGHITKGADSTLTLGKYQVKWQDFKYDSLPKLTAALQKQVPGASALKDGSFRVYYLVSEGFVFTTTGLPIVKGFPVPYPDIEAAIKTLVITGQAAIREIAGAWNGPEMWIHDGRLGGAWFSAHRPVSIDCFSLRGSWVGSAKPSGTPGIWTLPGVDRNAFLRIVLPDGSRFHLPTRN
jgi:hypothetical protein